MFISKPYHLRFHAQEGGAGGGAGGDEAAAAAAAAAAAGGGGGDAAAAAAAAAAKAAAGGQDEFLITQWKESLPEELQKSPTLVDIKTIEDLAKSYVSGQKLIGENRIPVPKEDWKEDQWNEYYKAIGRPEKPDLYEIAMPEGAPEGFIPNDDMQTTFKTACHKHGLNAKQAAGMWSEMQLGAYKVYESMTGQASTALNERTEALKKEWGADYDPRMKLANQIALAIENGGGLSGFNAWLKQSGAGVEPMIHKLLYIVGSQASEAQLGAGKISTGMSPAEAEARAQKIMSDDYPKGAYYDKKHPGHKARVKEVGDLFGIAAADEDAKKAAK